MKTSSIEILAPAGSFASLNSAINAGANAIYFGVGQLNMRAARALNFSFDDIAKVSQICQKNKVNSYLTLNTVVYDSEYDQINQILSEAKRCGINAVIASDMAVITLARKIGLSVHISTQLSISNFESVVFYSQFADRLVLARELTLVQIKSIIDQIKAQKITGPLGNLVEIEVFGHGAMCVAVSGRCSMSLCGYNSSANRGQCVQVCRRQFKVIDPETNQELIIDNNYVMSASDLCTIGMLDKLVDAGITCLKIEGRGRPPEYVDTVVRTYKDALSSIESNTYNQEKIDNYLQQLSRVYNRGFSTGFFMGLKGDSWAGVSDNKSTVSKIRVGKITKFYSKISVAEIKIIDKVDIKTGDSFQITGGTTGIVYGKFGEIKKDDLVVKSATQLDNITFTVDKKVRPGDVLFLVIG